MNKAVIYTRVSTQGQEEGTSLANQAQACALKAESLNAVVVDLIEEIMSGGLYMARTGLQRALDLIESGQANMMIVYRLDRMGRELDSLRDIKRRIENAGAKLIFTDGLEVKKGAAGKFIFTQFGALAEIEKDFITERLSSGLRKKAAKGIQPARTYCPLGYYIVKKQDFYRGDYPKEEVGKYIIIPGQAELVRKIFNQYIELRSLRGVVAWLHHQDILSQTGNLYWKPCTLRQILRNEVYKGIGTYAKDRHRPGTDQDEEDDWVRFETPPIITQEIWASANETLQGGNGARSGRSRYMLTGLVFCPKCGSRMYAIRIRDTATSGRLCGYGCSNVYPFDAPGGARGNLKCDRRKYNGGVLERMLMEGLDYIFSQPELIQAAIDKYTKLQKSKPQPDAQSEITSLRSTIAKSSKMEITAARSVIQAQVNGSDGAAFEVIRKESEAKRLQAETRLAQLQTKNKKLKPLEIKTESWALFKSTFESDRISEADKGQLLKEFIEAIYPQPHPTRKPYNTGGLEVILKTNTPEKLIMRNVIGEKISLKFKKKIA